MDIMVPHWIGYSIPNSSVILVLNIGPPFLVCGLKVGFKESRFRGFKGF
jgi:hypothetical protein